jgi:hypothetical protein
VAAAALVAAAAAVLPRRAALAVLAALAESIQIEKRKMMTRWRTRLAAMTVLVLPACIVLSCGDTEHAGDTTVGTDGGASDGGAADGGAPSKGGTRPVGGGGSGTAGSGGLGFGGIPMVPGISDMPKTVTCGKAKCGSVTTVLPNLFVDPCCAGDQCGVSTQLLSSVGFSSGQACEAKNQEGPLDAGCPSTDPQVIPANGLPVSVAGFAGCCRAETGTCGVVVDDLTIEGLGIPLASPQLGCVDSAPFFNGKPGASCGPQAGGGASSGGAPAGGAPAEGGTPAAGGASAGAGGN